MGVCYVCMDEGAPPSRCLCKDMFIHDACLVRAVCVTGAARCSVCRGDFPHVVCRSRTTWRSTAFLRLNVAVACLGGIVFSTSGVLGCVYGARMLKGSMFYQMCLSMLYMLMMTGAFGLLSVGLVGLCAQRRHLFHRHVQLLEVSIIDYI